MRLQKLQESYEFIHDIISKKKNDQPDLLFENLNNNNTNIKYTIESMPQKFLDTKIIYENNQIKTKLHRNESKLPVHWTSKIPKRYKRNAIYADLNRAVRTASTFAEDIPILKRKFLNADYPPRFVKQSNEKCSCYTQDNYTVPPNFTDIPKPLFLASLDSDSVVVDSVVVDSVTVDSVVVDSVVVDSQK